MLWIEENDLEEPEFIEKCKEQFQKEGSCMLYYMPLLSSDSKKPSHIS
jgi:hypothetical protein